MPSSRIGTPWRSAIRAIWRRRSSPITDPVGFCTVGTQQISFTGWLRRAASRESGIMPSASMSTLPQACLHGPRHGLDAGIGQAFDQDGVAGAGDQVEGNHQCILRPGGDEHAVGRDVHAGRRR